MKGSAIDLDKSAFHHTSFDGGSGVDPNVIPLDNTLTSLQL